jgi:hypothetical protein
MLKDVVHVVANEPAPKVDEATGNVAVVLLSLDVNGKLQFCFGGFVGAHVVRGLEFLHADT